MTMQATPFAIDAVLTAGESKGAWTYATLAGSSEALGTRKAVRVRATVDGHDAEVTLLPMGDGTHLFPMNTALRKVTGKGAGDTVALVITLKV